MSEPGWYPQQDGTRRYWDGSVWTEHVQASASDPGTRPKTRFRWLKSRTAIGIGAGVLGLIIGAASAGSADTSGAQSSLAAKVSSLQKQNRTLEQHVDELADSATSQRAEAEDQVTQAVADAVAEQQAAAETAQVAAVEAAVADAVAKERAKADARVQAAKEAAAADAPKPVTASGASSTDPRFDTCGEANDNGYGSYEQGVDPEYDWYDDRDHDGMVCEY
jgi:hypothetical protein